MHSALPDIKTSQFEGPYELLLELAQQRKIDLSELSLREITDSFIAYIETTPLPPETIASFIVVAATLLLMKARRIVPSLSPEEEEEIEHLRKRLTEYQQYREVANILFEQWDTMRLFPAHFFAEGVYQERLLPHGSITKDMLEAALQRLVASKPTPPDPTAHLTLRGRSLKELWNMFTDRLMRARELIFQEEIQGISPQEKAVSFLAVLEMARQQKVQLEQEQAFGTLRIRNL